jgi:N-acetylglucosamine kinase-like BadF-type ATPase
MKYFLGIDVGSSKTYALIADEMGCCIGFGKSAGGNHQTVGYDGLTNVLLEAFGYAIHMLTIEMDQFEGAGFGVAGYDFQSDRDDHRNAISHLRLSCPMELVNDGVLGLMAGATHGVGVNVTAGSSVNCRGRGRDGGEGRIVGNGMEFGEHAGAYEIVQRGLHMVNYTWIKRIPATALTKIYLEAAGAQDELELMELISNGEYYADPYLAIQVIDAAQAGDPAAGEVVRWAGEELGWLAVSVARQIGMENNEVEIIQSGSIFNSGEVITEPMRQVILRNCPKARLVRLDGPPVVGAIILGMEQAGFDGYSIRDNIVKTAKELIQ